MFFPTEPIPQGQRRLELLIWDHLWPSALAFSPDGRILAVSYEHSLNQRHVFLWLRAANGRWEPHQTAIPDFTAAQPDSCFRHIAFWRSGNGLMTAADASGLILTWPYRWRAGGRGTLNWRSGDEQVMIEESDLPLEIPAPQSYRIGSNEMVMGLQYSPAAAHLLIHRSDGVVLVSEVADAGVGRPYRVAKNIRLVAWTPQNSLMACNLDGVTAEGRIVADVLTGRTEAVFHGPPIDTADEAGVRQEPTCLAFSPGGAVMAIGCRGGQLLMYRRRRGRWVKYAVRKAHGDKITAISFSGGGLVLATGSLDRTVAVWKVGGGASNPLDRPELIDLIENLVSDVHHLQFNPADARELVIDSHDFDNETTETKAVGLYHFDQPLNDDHRYPGGIKPDWLD